MHCSGRVQKTLDLINPPPPDIVITPRPRRAAPAPAVKTQNPDYPIMWLTKAELAAHLKCTARHINTLMKRRILPYLKTRGLVRFDLNECEHSLEMYKTRSRFEHILGAMGSPLASAPQPPCGKQAELAPPLSSAAAPETLPLSGSAATARAFASLGEARDYLADLESDESREESTSSDGQAAGTLEQAPITVIILRRAPVA